MAKFIRPSFKILTDVSNSVKIYKHLELCGRVCYKSEPAITDDSYIKFLEKIIHRGHESILEHFSISVNFIVDRGLTHELVRHRLCSFSQESTRYCNYSDEKFGSELTFIIPSKWLGVPNSSWTEWEESLSYLDQVANGESITTPIIDDVDKSVSAFYSQCVAAEETYLELLKLENSPQVARGVLPNCLKTEINVTANIREWRHIFKLRTSKDAHPDIVYIMKKLLVNLKSSSIGLPLLFLDI